jgi:hypothetical protein
MRKKQKKIKRLDTNLLITCILVLFFLISFWSIPKLYNLATPLYEQQVEKLTAQAEVGLNQAILDNEATTRAIVQENDLPKIIASEDPYGLVAFINAETKQKDLNVLQIVNADGTILARAANLTRRGDNIFLSTPWGQIVSQGTTVNSYTTNVYGNTRILTGIPLFQNQAIIGAVFAGHELDDTFATSFRNKYLPADSEVAFYNDQSGIIGDSFQDQEIKKIIDQNFRDKALTSSGQNTKKHFHIKINDKYYLAETVSLPNVNFNKAKIIVFAPHYHGTEVALISALLTLLLFGSLLLINHRQKLFGRYFQSAAVVICVVFYASSFIIILHQVSRRHQSLNLAPYPLYNSRLFVSPTSSVFDKKFDQQISITLSSGGEAINAIEANLTFDPTIIQIDDIDTSTSICRSEMFLEKSFNNQTGEIHLTCLIPTPGFAKDNGVIANLKIHPIQAGMVNIGFNDSSLVLANDGLATNVLRTVSNGSYEVLETNSSDNSQPIFSYTHPNSEQWYQDRTISLSWNNPKGEDYLFSFDQSPTFDSATASSTTATSTTVIAPSNGVYYAHLQPANNPHLPAVSKKIMIDDSAPSNLTIKIKSAVIKRGESVPLQVEAQDDTSGLEKNFYLKSETGLFLPARNPVYLSYPRKGTYPVTVRVYDLAGNYSERTINITVK